MAGSRSCHSSCAGDLGWLAEAPPREEHIGREMAEKNAKSVVSLAESARALGLALPEPFARFAGDPSLQGRIRSNTDCFLDFGEAPVTVPGGDGFLVRFLCDSQGCVFWYLYLTADGSDHAVVASTDFCGTEAELDLAANWASDEPDPGAIVYCGESFEEFLGRFWLENEVWFAAHGEPPMPEAGATYLRRYRERQSELGMPAVGGWESPAEFLPWPHVQARIDRINVDYHESGMEWARATYGGGARACPDCGRDKASLFWTFISSPKADWDAGTGRVGFLTLCETCRRQVDFVVLEEATEEQARRWREERRLI